MKKFGGSLELSDGWARHTLKDLNWTKRKGTTGKVEPSKKFLDEEKFTFQRNISKAILENHIPKEFGLDSKQDPLVCGFLKSL